MTSIFSLLSFLRKQESNNHHILSERSDNESVGEILPLKNVTQCVTIIVKKSVKISELIWNDENVGHVARHGVNPLEVEDVCFGAHLSQKERNGRYVLSGQTGAGRYLNVVVEKIGQELYRPVTAFEMSETYKRRYRKRMRSGKP